MSDDLNNAIKQIADMLSQDGLPDSLKGLLSLLGSPDESKQDSAKAEPQPQVKEEKTERGPGDENTEFVRNIRKMMDQVSSRNDPRVNLLNAIKPFLNNTRQNKLNSCINLLQLSNLNRFIEENDK